MGIGELTRLLQKAVDGDESARNLLYSNVYEELRSLARAQLRRAANGEVQTDALVHEAYLRMFGGAPLSVRDRSHFWALSSRVMRQVLVDYFRSSVAARRGGQERPITLDEYRVGAASPGELVLSVHESLEVLEKASPRLAQVVECKFFAGLNYREIGEALGVTERTVARDWRAAKTWLANHLAGE